MQTQQIADAPTFTTKVMNITVIVTGLGYFIDMFDMFLFNMLRVKSLSDLGLNGDSLTQAGLWVANCQWAGLLLGAYLSGTLGDRYGRKASLFLSIILYSLGTLACAFITDVHAYGAARFITGLGLAGELGAGITLITEKLHPTRRGQGVMIFIVLGFAGVLGAAFVAEFVPWRSAYLIGGIAGLGLLLTRVLLRESGLYETMSTTDVRRGGLRIIAANPALLKKYICAVLLMSPSVFIPQLVWTLSPELGKAMGVMDAVKPNIVLAVGFSCVILGDLMACVLSEKLKSRKKAALIFLIIGGAMFMKYLFWPASGLLEFYIFNGLLGLTLGAWVIGAVWAAEHFGTNIRATATTTIPNFARCLSIPMNMIYGHLKWIDPLTAIGLIGFTIFTLAILGWRGLSETYGRDLDYLEKN